MFHRWLTAVLSAALLVGATVAVSPTPAGAAIGDITTYPVPGADVADLAGITSGPDGALWYTDFFRDTIGRVDPDTGAVTTYTEPDVFLPFDITTGPDGNLWFTNALGSSVGRLDPDDGTITHFGVPFAPVALTAGPDGNLWITSLNTDLHRLDPENGTSTTFAGAGAFSDVTVGSDGNLWYPSGARTISRFDLGTGTSTVFSDSGIHISEHAGFGIALGPDGNVWFTSTENDRIGRITPAGAITMFSDPAGNVDAPIAITAGDDGNLWFTNASNNRVGRVDPDDGSFTSFEHPEVGFGQITGITAGPDGAVWFTSDHPRVGRIQVLPAPSTTSLTSSANPSSAADGVTFTATVAGDPDGPVPTGTVTFRNGTSTLGEAMLDGTAVATLTTDSLAVGSHDITAEYLGDAEYRGSTSPVLTQHVHVTPTTLRAEPAVLRLTLPSLRLSVVNAAATLTRSDTGTPVAGQPITFRAGDQQLCTAVTDATGRAKCPPVRVSGLLGVLLAGGYDASFAGSPIYGSSSAHGPLVRG